jgi:hypothetical protein
MGKRTHIALVNKSRVLTYLEYPAGADSPIGIAASFSSMLSGKSPVVRAISPSLMTVSLTTQESGNENPLADHDSVPVMKTAETQPPMTALGFFMIARKI